MSVYILLLLSLFYFNHLGAQQPAKRIAVNDSTSNQPLVLVDSFVTELNYLLLDTKKIKSINILKDSTAVNRFGLKGRNGVILIQTTENTHLLRLPALLDAFSFPASQRNLRISINEVIVRQPALLLIDPSEVQSIDTKVLPKWYDLRNNEEETFINITKKEKG